MRISSMKVPDSLGGVRHLHNWLCGFLLKS
nr:MAG TPA: hypothetical protein [Caudoviricetes sp.]